MRISRLHCILGGLLLVAILPAHAQWTELEGSHPIAQPKYDGVEQLLVLSDRWVIVVTSTVPEMMSEIDALSHGAFKQAADAWDAGLARGRQDWNARRTAQGIRDQYIARARENVGERELSMSISYQIESADDSRYASPRMPDQVGHTLVGIGEGKGAGAPEVDYVHYAYLGLPEPMRPGSSYSITVRGKKRVTFLFDEDKTVSRAIKVNQLGYLTDAPRKFAYLGCHLYGVGPMDLSMYPRFEVVNAADGKVAFGGYIKLRDRDSQISATRQRGSASQGPLYINGEDVYEMDLGPLKETGDFYIRIPGVGRSWPFHHGPDTYGPVFYTAARGLYHQRCGIAYEEPYTAWKRIRCHTAPVYESDYIAFPYGDFGKPKDYNPFDIIAATIDRSRKTENVWGGWHDAADWDRRDLHYSVVFDLLYAYELVPGHFSDAQLNIPESGNGIPDILDEVAYGLEVWVKSMTPEGGCSGDVETYGHPKIDQDIDYAFSRRSRWDTLLFTAAAAQLAQHLKSFSAEQSDHWKELALKAYAYGNNPANSLGKVDIPAVHDRGRGAPYTIHWEEKEQYVAPSLLHARLRLYKLTGDKSYLEGVGEAMHSTPKPYEWPYTQMDYSPWLYFSAVYGPDSFLPDFQRKKLIQEYLLAPADKLVDYLDGIPYRRSWRRDQNAFMGFGNTDMTNPARVLLIAYALTRNPKYRDAAILNFDFMLGANPMGMSWTTGLGYVYPINIQHEVSTDDGIADPVPGITIYGITGGMYRKLIDTVWQSPSGNGGQPVVFDAPNVPLWRRWSCHPYLDVAQCEFTIQETMSSTIFCSALLMDDGWAPSDALKQRGPRPEEVLYGLWYLP